ncbi:MAG: hypothetical protein LUD54_05605, partial [Oscillospiraceae bacterium]|nr:hypothetical protein [Oscillospiraceae bacterium]
GFPFGRVFAYFRRAAKVGRRRSDKTCPRDKTQPTPAHCGQPEQIKIHLYFIFRSVRSKVNAVTLHRIEKKLAFSKYPAILEVQSNREKSSGQGEIPDRR